MRTREGVGVLTHQHDMLGRPHHAGRDSNRVQVSPQSADAAATPWRLHHGAVKAHSAARVRQPPVPNRVNARIPFGLAAYFETRFQGPLVPQRGVGERGPAKARSRLRKRPGREQQRSHRLGCYRTEASLAGPVLAGEMSHFLSCPDQPIGFSRILPVRHNWVSLSLGSSRSRHLSHLHCRCAVQPLPHASL